MIGRWSSPNITITIITITITITITIITITIITTTTITTTTTTTTITTTTINQGIEAGSFGRARAKESRTARGWSGRCDSSQRRRFAFSLAAPRI